MPAIVESTPARSRRELRDSEAFKARASHSQDPNHAGDAPSATEPTVEESHAAPSAPRNRREAKAAMAAFTRAPAKDPWHFPALDGMRGLAIASVLLYHSNWSSRGLLGVDVFFVISGFLITLLLLRRLGTSGRIGFGAFFLNRAKRLLPGLLLVLAAVLILTYQLGDLQELKHSATKSLGALLQVANWQQLLAGDAYWDRMGQTTPLAHIWSLSVTEQFYLLWPLILLGVWKLCRARPDVVFWVLGLLLAGSAMIAPLMWDGTNSERLYLGTDSRSVGFVAGAAAAALIYMHTLRKPSHLRPASRGKTAAVTSLSVLSLGLVVALNVAADSYQAPWLYQGGLAVVAVAAAILAATLTSPWNLLARFFSFWPFVAFGKISYTVFLLHLPIFWLVQKGFPGLPPLMLFAAGGLLTWVLSLIIHYSFSEKLRRAKWRPQTTVPALAITISAILAGSLLMPDLRTAQMANTELSAQSKLLGSDGEPMRVLPGAGGQRPTVLTLGDSLANDYATMLSSHGSSSFAVVDGGTGGCGIMSPDQVRSSNGYIWEEQAHCQSWEQSWPGLLQKSVPDYILLHLYWDASEQLIDGQWLKACDPAFSDRYRAHLGKFLTWAAEVNPQAKIVFANDRPTNGIIAEKAWTDCFGQILQSVVDQDPQNRTILDWAGKLCPEGRCESTDSFQKPLFLADDVHLSVQGMKALTPWLERELAALRPAPTTPHS